MQFILQLFLILLSLPLMAATIDSTQYVEKGMAQITFSKKFTVRGNYLDRQAAELIQNKINDCRRYSVNKGKQCLRKLEHEIYYLSPNARQLLKETISQIFCNSQCYDKKKGGFFSQIAKLIFLIDIMSGDSREIAQSFANVAMCYWSHNNFAKAKQYIDKFEHLFPLAEFSYGISPDSISHAESNLVFQKAQLWFFGHRFVRFMENTRRTFHKPLCRKGKKNCLNAAWEMMQKVKSASFQEALKSSLLSNAPSKVSSLYKKRAKLKLERAFLELISTYRKVSYKTRRRIKKLNEEIQDLDFKLYRRYPSLKQVEMTSIINLSKFKRTLKNNETFISFIFSMGCRPPLVWRIERNKRVQFKRAGLYNKCTTKELIIKILNLRNKIQTGMSLNELDHDLSWFRQHLFDPIGLPPIGSKLILSVDEKLAGLPFELIPTKYGRLGEIYQITYVPSASVLYKLRTSYNNTYFYKTYTAFGRDRHTHFGLNKLNVNQALSQIAPITGSNTLVVTEAKERAIYNKHNIIARTKYLHFMTHSYNMNGFLGLSYGNGRIEDGLLTGPEIAAKLSINADTVLVTACDSAGASQQLLPGEAFSSLAVGFITAGAKRLLITLWPVTDEVAANIAAIYLYNRQKGRSPHAALQIARKTLKNQEYPPYYWGGFVLMGD